MFPLPDACPVCQYPPTAFRPERHVRQVICPGCRTPRETRARCTTCHAALYGLSTLEVNQMNIQEPRGAGKLWKFCSWACVLIALPRLTRELEQNAVGGFLSLPYVEGETTMPHQRPADLRAACEALRVDQLDAQPPPLPLPPPRRRRAPAKPKRRHAS